MIRRLIRTAARSRPQAPSLYLNLDEPAIRTLVEDTPGFARLVDAHAGPSGRLLVFLDEVQRVPECGLVLKRLHDLDLPCKLVATGSASLQIRARIKESLAGRKRVYTLRPFALGEVVAGVFDPSPVAADVARELDRVHGAHLSARLDRLLVFGGYPEASFVVRRVRPFSGNPATEVVRSRRAWFWDNGLRNWIAGRLGAASDHPDRGPLLEGLVGWMLEDRLPPGGEVRFWRTRSKAEVDFVVTGPGTGMGTGTGPSSPMPVEVKAGELRRPTVPRSLRSFIHRYQPPHGLVVTGEGWHEVDVEGCRVRFVPARWLPFLSLPGLA